MVAVGCNLPTAPEHGHSALVSNDSVTVARRRAAEPYGHRQTPPCSAPAPLHSARPENRAPGYIFKFRDGTNPQLVTAELAAKYDFTPQAVFNLIPGFAAVVSEQALAGIRCDSRVEFVEYDIIGQLAN
jgi:hypothetical protein